MPYKKIDFESTTKFNKNGVDFIGYGAINNNLSVVMETVKDCMEHVLDLPVPLIAEVRSGSSWYDTK